MIITYVHKLTIDRQLDNKLEYLLLFRMIRCDVEIFDKILYTAKRNTAIELTIFSWTLFIFLGMCVNLFAKGCVLFLLNSFLHLHLRWSAT